MLHKCWPIYLNPYLSGPLSGSPALTAPASLGGGEPPRGVIVSTRPCAKRPVNCPPCQPETRQPLSRWAGPMGSNVAVSYFLFSACFFSLWVNKKDNSCAWILCFNNCNNAQEIGWLRDSAPEGSCHCVDRAGGRGRVKGRKEEDPWGGQERIA